MRDLMSPFNYLLGAKFLLLYNMDEQSSYTPDRDEHHYSNIANQSLDDKRLNPHFFFQHNPAHSPSQPIFALHSPSPFKKQINLEMHEDSEEHQRFPNKQIKEIGLFQLEEMDNWELKEEEEEVEGYEALSNMRKMREGKNTEKGLKKLSKQVFEIILRLKTATYKQIAKQLLRNFKGRGYSLEMYGVDSRTEQNIRRRVYDALNVLVAVGLLRKNGKKVVYEPILKIEQKEKIDSIQYSDEKNDPNKLKHLLEQKKTLLDQKKQQISLLLTNYRMLDLFTKRKQLTHFHPNPKISFPAISLIYDNHPLNCIHIRANIQRCYLEVKKLHKLEGDVDIMHRLNHIENEVKMEKENKNSRTILHEF